MRVEGEKKRWRSDVKKLGGGGGWRVVKMERWIEVGWVREIGKCGGEEELYRKECV